MLDRLLHTHQSHKSTILLLFFSIFLLLNPSFAEANSKYSGLVIDANTGKILYQENAGSYRYPASLTKMMTLYLTFDALKKGTLHIDQKILVSAHAAAQPPSGLGLRKGQRIVVRDAIMSLIVKSANDAAVVLAEAIAGSEWSFARMMTEKAHALGMKNTEFRNASGLHDSKQRTTAYDMARLGRALQRNHAKFYPLFSRTKFTYNGHTIHGHNRVTKYYPGADGIKTGYVNASGFNLVSSAERNGIKLIAVVLGGKTSRSRDQHMRKLLDTSFRKMAGGQEQQVVSNTPAPTLKKSSSELKTSRKENSKESKEEKRAVQAQAKKDQTKQTKEKTKAVAKANPSSAKPAPVMKPNVPIELTIKDINDLVEQGGER